MKKVISMIIALLFASAVSAVNMPAAPNVQVPKDAAQQVTQKIAESDAAVSAKVSALNQSLASLKIDFQYNKATLPKEGSTEQLIQSAAATIQKITAEIPKGYSLNVVGHATKVGGDVYNADLAQRRAQTVTDRITKAGVVSSVLKTTNDGTSRDMMAVTFEIRKN